MHQADVGSMKLILEHWIKGKSKDIKKTCSENSEVTQERKQAKAKSQQKACLMKKGSKI